MASVKKRETGDHEMSEEQDIHDAEAFRREQERMIREHAEWPQRLEPVCREAEARWRAAHPWTGAARSSSPCRCVVVGARRSTAGYLARPGRENGQSGDRESCYADLKSAKDRAGAKGGDLRAALLSAHLSQSAGHQKDVLACQWRRFKVRLSWRIGAKTEGKSLRRLIGAAAGAAVSRCRNRLSDQLSAFAC
jgi:hypothetical protein